MGFSRLRGIAGRAQFILALGPAMALQLVPGIRSISPKVCHGKKQNGRIWRWKEAFGKLLKQLWAGNSTERSAKYRFVAENRA
jgi:hypothetical protein